MSDNRHRHRSDRSSDNPTRQGSGGRIFYDPARDSDTGNTTRIAPAYPHPATSGPTLQPALNYPAGGGVSRGGATSTSGGQQGYNHPAPSEQYYTSTQQYGPTGTPQPLAQQTPVPADASYGYDAYTPTTFDHYGTPAQGYEIGSAPSVSGDYGSNTSGHHRGPATVPETQAVSNTTSSQAEYYTLNGAVEPPKTKGLHEKGVTVAKLIEISIKKKVEFGQTPILQCAQCRKVTRPCINSGDPRQCCLGCARKGIMDCLFEPSSQFQKVPTREDLHNHARKLDTAIQQFLQDEEKRKQKEEARKQKEAAREQKAERDAARDKYFGDKEKRGHRSSSEDKEKTGNKAKKAKK
ncbi:hypothetical protein QBC37DRAFT_406345 [Rhypophila decipiens]|uniref:Uncharacterized protein n=1 Tax=Rhypophila decipiens TaxID=261697 RepID=A0AAN6XVE7_9PEZI|nr:hypothetical protein QBC37DRAFT_406345 [Rhypophila decipiens]